MGKRRFVHDVYTNREFIRLTREGVAVGMLEK